MIPFVNMSQEDWFRLQQAYQGPQRPPAMWKRACAFSIRAACYVIASPVIIFLGVVCLLLWAFMLEEKQ